MDSRRSFGIYRPERKAKLWGLVFGIGLILLAYGILSESWAGSRSRFYGGEIAIALGLFATIPGFFLARAFYLTAREMAAMRRGTGVVARWVVPPATFEMFRASELRNAQDGHPNGYRLSPTTPPDGVEVIFGADSALVGDTYFGLPIAGLSKILQVGYVQGSNPRCLGFTTSTTLFIVQSIVSTSTELGMLRVPLPSTAEREARMVIDHYGSVIGGLKNVGRDSWQSRKRWGLRIAAIAAVAAVAGFSLEAMEIGKGTVAPLLGITGTMGVIGGLLLALQGWAMAGKQR